MGTEIAGERLSARLRETLAWSVTKIGILFRGDIRGHDQCVFWVGLGLTLVGLGISNAGLEHYPTWWKGLLVVFRFQTNGTVCRLQVWLTPFTV
jgi:hypothetical protein